MRAPLPHPFVRLSARARRFSLLVLAPLAIAMMIVLSPLDARLRTPASPNGIVCFEFAGDRDTAGRMLEAWGSQGRRDGAWPALAAACAGPEFALFGVGLPYLAIFSVARLRAREAA